MSTILISKHFALELLAANAYEARFVNPFDSIGIAFDSQTGLHALGTDRQSQFYTRANSTAYLPRGCDVFSRSDQGGEYLKLSCYDDSLRSYFGAEGARGLASGNALYLAKQLRLVLLKAEYGHADQAYIEAPSLDALALDWLSSLSSRPAKGFESSVCRDIETYCHKHLSESLEIADLAQAFGLSSAHFSRQFKASFGQSPYDYLIQRRLAYARYLLKCSEQPITDIALACGFNTHAHMSAVFTRCLGLSPKHFRG